MPSIELSPAKSPRIEQHETVSPNEIRQRVLAYYAAATADYRFWSSDFNMHFGYWRRGMNPFKREAMLLETNRQILSRLGLTADQPARIADLGCGTGATARTAVGLMPKLLVDAVTIAPIQVSIGSALNAKLPRGDAITMHCADFAHTPLPSAQYDAVYLLESACHAEGSTKAELLREAFRLLKPGGRLIIVDAMLRRALPTQGLFSRLMNFIYRRWCLSWAVPEMCRLDLLPDALATEGFEVITLEDWSWNIAPSVAHVPLFSCYFAIIELIKARGSLPTWRWRHILAALLTPLLGLNRSTFAYAAVVARKPRSSRAPTQTH